MLLCTNEKQPFERLPVQWAHNLLHSESSSFLTTVKNPTINQQIKKKVQTHKKSEKYNRIKGNSLKFEIAYIHFQVKSVIFLKWHCYCLTKMNGRYQWNSLLGKCQFGWPSIFKLCLRTTCKKNAAIRDNTNRSINCIIKKKKKEVELITPNISWVRNTIHKKYFYNPHSEFL